jgi:aminoglycoside/choline kinase family phosphotransferase
MEELLSLYKEWKGEEAKLCVRLKGAGSNREYYRLTSLDGETVIGVKGTSAQENEAFIYLSGHFDKQGIPVPKVLGVSGDSMCYLQTDLGDISLFDAIREGREKGGDYSNEEGALLARVIRLLPKIQFEGAKGLDATRCYPQMEFNKTGVMFDLNYFKYCFLKPSGVEFNEVELEKAFREFAKNLIPEHNTTFMYRDFQARNVMLYHGEPYFIDFQGGRRGPIQYDLVSFLWQASAHYPYKLRDFLMQLYFEELEKYMEVDRQEFGIMMMGFEALRLMQVLGAYGYRGYFERKPHFLQSIPAAMENLEHLLEDGALLWIVPKYLMEILSDLVEKYNATKHAKASVSKYDGAGSLVVDVYSFAYPKGIPADESGNGGGYVFDCRAIHNPGRYDEYKPLTGLDAPVMRFLEENGEVLTFLSHVYELADAHAARYIKRGFTHLQFAFGCTGGRHRSVYCAQHVAEHLHEKFGIEVRIHHREQNIESLLAAVK